ncbi:MAG: glycosyltransferase [Flavisolibacter sp.]|nr:glycosyltransferase [Flavisolibacter sp.]
MATEQEIDPSIEILTRREQYRDRYWHRRDPIVNDRLLWRAQSFRHMVHLLPGQSILELGCGDGLFTQQLYRVSRGENPITAVTFREGISNKAADYSSVEFLHLSSLPGQLKDRTFDFVIAMDLMDKSNCASFLQMVYTLLKPGGQIIFYESNPWNFVLQMNRIVRTLFGEKDQRRLANRTQLYELISQLGFIKIFAVYNDFVYAPLTSIGAWWLRNLSILLENFPYVRTLAGSILIHAQKPPQSLSLPAVSLCDHEALKGKISVVVPCHNEEMNVRPLVTQLVKFYGEYLYEIILVDDNSKDNTRMVITKLAEEYPMIHPVFRTPPNGVGRAIMDGYKAASGTFILSMDCDFQHLLPELRDLFDAAMQGNDVIIGSRFSRHSVLLNYPFKKIVANRAFHFLARMMFGGHFRDFTNNLKLIRREVIEKLELTQPGFSINAETGFMPFLMGYKVTEVPISWINRTPDMGMSSFKLVKVGGGYWDVLKRLWMKYVFHRNKYYPNIRLRKINS